MEERKPVGMPDIVWEHVRKLKHEDPDVRWKAAEALGEIGHKSAVQPLAQTLLKDKNANVRARAADALGDIGHKSAVQPLAQTLLKDKDYFVKWRAAVALGDIGHESGVQPLVQVLKDGYGDIRRRAVEALGKIGKSAIPHLTKALKDKNGGVREAAVIALGEIGRESAIPHLAKALKDENEDVRREAARALGMVGRGLKEPVTREGKALLMVGKYFHEGEDPRVVVEAYNAALNGLVDESNVGLYVKQLRALQGNLK
jgi:HEAT repeat protein